MAVLVTSYFCLYIQYIATMNLLVMYFGENKILLDILSEMKFLSHRVYIHTAVVIPANGFLKWFTFSHALYKSTVFLHH